MLRAIRRALGAHPGGLPEAESLAGHRHHPVQLAVAVLLHEARRADSEETKMKRGTPSASAASISASVPATLHSSNAWGSDAVTNPAT